MSQMNIDKAETYATEAMDVLYTILPRDILTEVNNEVYDALAELFEQYGDTQEVPDA